MPITASLVTPTHFLRCTAVWNITGARCCLVGAKQEIFRGLCYIEYGNGYRYCDQSCCFLIRSCKLSQCCESTSEERNAGNPHVAFCGNRRRVTASGDPIVRPGYIQIREERLHRLKEKVRKLTRRNSPVNLEKVISDLNPVIRGFANYFKIADCKSVFKDLAQWIRRRLRAKQLRLWKVPKHLHRRLRQLGYKGEFESIKMNSWRNSASPLAHYAMTNIWLKEMGLYELEKVATGLLSPRKRG